MDDRKLGITAAAILFFILLQGGLSWVIWKVYEEKKAYILDHDRKVLLDVYNSTQLGYKKLTKLLYDEVINKPDVINIFKNAREADPEIQAGVRDTLYKRLVPSYERLKSLNLRQLHFHLPDATSFLRFHKPSSFGDNLSDIRYSVVMANRDRRYVEGLEEGRVYNGFRHVYPLNDLDGNHIGSVEMALSFNALRSDIAETTGNHIDFVIKRSIVERKVWPEAQKHYYASPLSGAYLHEKDNDPTYAGHHGHEAVTSDIASQAGRMMHRNKPFAVYSDGYAVAFLPITNVEGEEGAAYLISYHKTDAVEQVLHTSIILWCISAAGMFITALLMYLLMLKIMQINALATYDPLTRLYNRNSLGKRLEDEVARVQRTDERLAVVFLDVDNFKSINDRFGHETGDKVLKSLSELLVDNLRRNDAVGRWGGEEFLLCLPNTDLEKAVIVAEKLRHAVESADFSIGERVTCSFGVTVYKGGETIDAMVSRADAHLYHAKDEGKNCVRGS